LSGVRLDTVTKRYGATTIVDRLSLDVDPGELLVFLGPSGCGKSTLLRAIAGLETIEGGSIHIGDRRIDHLPPGQRNVAMVFQQYALYPHMSVRENMAFGLRNARVPADEIATRIAMAARILEIADYLDRRPTQLSGGQRQRVAIARAIVKQPDLFLLDEPLSNLDAALRMRTRVELAQLQRDLGTTMIFVTHDQVEAMTLADRIVVLNGGRIEQVAPPMEIYRRPRTRFVACFVGSPRINLLPATVRPGVDGLALATLPGGGTIQTRVPCPADAAANGVELGLRAEHLRVTPTADDLSATVDLVERLGERTLVHARLDDGSAIVAEDAGLSQVRTGDRVELGVDRGAAMLFDGDGIGHHAADPA
jgi:multiple sugar transport system ATP-binding protein